MSETKGARLGYPKRSFEAKLDEMLPREWEKFDVIAYELWREDGGWAVNDLWFIARKCDRADAIYHLKQRWAVFKANYHSRARIYNLTDVAMDGPTLLEVDGIAFAEVRESK